MMQDDLAGRLIEASPDGLVLVDSVGKIRVANQSMAQIFGVDVDDLIGRHVEELVPIELRQRHVEHREHFVVETRARPMGSGLQLFAQHADGDLFPVEVSLSPVIIEDDHFTIATVRDVSDRQEAKAAMALLEDRERIARDLHDMVIQRLFAAGMSLEATAGLVRDDTVATRIRATVDELDSTIRELRSAIFQLGQADEGQTLAARLASVVSDRTSQLGFTPTLQLAGDISSIDRLVGEQLIATVIEALSNVARHARATRTDVVVRRSGGELQLEIVDDGVGIVDSTKENGGLTNMMWRAAELGGLCLVERAEPSGTRLAWHVPV